MIDQKELRDEINRILDEIEEDILAPVCASLLGPLDKEIKKKEILRMIAEKYKLKRDKLNSDWPLAMFALYILLDGEIKRIERED